MTGVGLPFFSIVVPVYNRERFVGQLIRSVLNQRFNDFELILVNDGSTDGTEGRISEFSDSRIKYLKIANSERGAARNAGAAIARGTYLNFFDSDDVMYDHHLSTAHEFISTRQSPEWFHVGFELCREDGSVITTECGVATNPYLRLIKTNYLGCDSVFIQRNFFCENRFNEDRTIASSEDWELWLRLISRIDLAVCSTVTFRMIHHENRSLLTISPDQIIKRDMAMTRSLMIDAFFVRKFKGYLRLFEADRYTFFSLCLIVEHRKAEAFRYILRSLMTTPLVLSRKRFWACIKLLVVDLFR